LEAVGTADISLELLLDDAMKELLEQGLKACAFSPEPNYTPFAVGSYKRCG
jgi:hypothetical protein